MECSTSLQDVRRGSLAASHVTRDELEEFAASDPAVLAGLLTFEVKTWYVAMDGQDLGKA